MNTPASTYRLHSVQGATPLGRVVMLYDAALARMHSAILAINGGNIQQRGIHLNRVLDIIVELEGTLNFARGGEVAQTLKAFYIYARATVLQASIENSSERIRMLVKHWTTVSDAWHQIERTPPLESAGPLPEMSTNAKPAPSELPSLHLRA